MLDDRRDPEPAATRPLADVVGGAVALVMLGLCACTGPARISLGAASPSPDGSADTSDATNRSDAPPSEGADALVDAAATPMLFLSPGGDDGNPGTRARPLRSFAFALGLLAPGTTLTLLDGTYDGGTSGYFDARCGANAVDGTEAAPITVRADHERAAFLRGDASGPPFHMQGCGHWVIEGLRAESDDFANAPDTIDAGSVFFLDTGNHDLVLRRLLARRPNRYKHSHVLRIADGSRDILVEECELYDFHHNAFETQRTDSVIFRRNYINPRGMPDLAGGYVSLDPARGDYGILLEETRFAIAENNLVENTHAGLGIVGRYIGYPSDQPPPGPDPLDGNRLLGNVVNQPFDSGIRLESRCMGEASCTDRVRTVLNTTLTDDVVIGGVLGVSSAGAVNTTIAQLTVVGAASGVVFAKEPQNVGVTSSSSTVDSLVVGFQSAGFRAEGENDWSFDHCAAAPAAGATGAGYLPDDPHVTSRISAQPDLGGCLVYLPAGSQLRGAGSGTRDVGASVLERYEGGLLTTKPLWAPTTGAFPCGAIVAGVNDDPATSCSGVHLRLHVATTACPLP
jgi:hypothetical protein